MRHFRLFLFLFVGLFFLFMLVLYGQTLSAFAEEGNPSEQQTEVNIATSPASAFIGGRNLAPGDGIQSEIVIHNKGQQDFEYEMTAYKEAGSDLLYDIFYVEIEHEGRVIFEGPFRQLTYLDMGVLQSKAHDQLHVTVQLPLHAGNEYQGLETVVAFDFSAKARGPSHLLPSDPSVKDGARDSGHSETRSSGSDSILDEEDHQAAGPVASQPTDGGSTPSGGGLPDTASGWLVLVLIGLLLIALGISIIAGRKDKKIKTTAM